MKRVVLFLALVAFSSAVFAQESSFSVAPKEFYNTLLFKAELQEKTNLTVQFLEKKSNNEKLVKTLNYNDVLKTAFKIDLSDLKAGKEYVIKVFNSNNELLFTEETKKSLKSKKK